MENTILDYLFSVYQCDDIEILKCRCPIDLRLLNLNAEATKEFKDAVDELDRKEKEAIYKAIKDKYIK